MEVEEYIMESEPDATAIINRKVVDYFSGCGYFGFQVHLEVVEAACDAVKKYGISSATTRAGYGTNPVLLEIEAKAAQFFETNDVLYYISGCLGSPVLLEALKDDYEVIFIDRESHYSSRLATSLVQKPVIIFEHRSPGDLNQKLKQHLKPSQRPLILCDGIFPISGEISPLPGYHEVSAGIEGAVICVDDAHATGVIGEKGHGSFEYFGMKGERFYSSGTLSKALGGHGGIIFGDDEFIKKLKQKSTLVNACSNVPIPSAAATAKALEILYNNPGIRKTLWDNVAHAKNGLRNLGFDINDTPVPIICLYSKEKEKIDPKALQLELFERNIAVTYVPYGGYTSVPRGGAVRISIFSTHTREQIDRLIAEIKRLV
ncbi:MAG: pyridoxal phosphate-dependent aminotransferase family protein [Candidatus Aminicenantes bacterium]|nr:MAG: pyridoxal phosphate-dependent aminotransferase family protein [Candidatus Aminicenantes bacterium]